MTRGMRKLEKVWQAWHEAKRDVYKAERDADKAWEIAKGSDEAAAAHAAAEKEQDRVKAKKEELKAWQELKRLYVADID